MAEQKDSNIAMCPNCDGPINLSGKRQLGQRFSCRQCNSTLAIANRKPLELVLVQGKQPGNIQVLASRKQSEKKRSTQPAVYQNGDYMEDPAMSTLEQVSMAHCPQCQARLRFHKSLRVGQLMACPECEETLEVVSLRPLELYWADEQPWPLDTGDDYDQYSDL